MTAYSLHRIKEITGGLLLQGDPDMIVRHLVLDSRKLVFPSDSLFFALKGARRDGHDFISDLFASGVRAFVVSEDTHWDAFPGAAFLRVDNTLDALQDIASVHRAQFNYPVLAITGSNGKTMVKEWLFQLMEEDLSIVRSPRSYNSQIGVPLSIWQMDDEHELGIFEAGVSQKGEMVRLERMIHPDVGIFTMIGEAHAEGFHSTEEKIREKLSLFIHAKTLIYCSDHVLLTSVIDVWKSELADGGNLPVILDWGHAEDAAICVLSTQARAGWTEITVREGLTEHDFRIPFTDNASVENILHCYTYLRSRGMDHSRIKPCMEKLRPLTMRLELKEGNNQCTIINDSYNSDWNSIQLVLDFLVQQSPHQKRTVILSDIHQSGKSDENLYADLAKVLRSHQVNRLIGIGPLIGKHRAFFDGTDMETAFFPATETFLELIHTLPFRDETILLKGSRIFELERIGRYLEKKIHQTRLEVNLSSIAHNLRKYRERIPTGTRIMVMVKAFSYGAGSYEVASLLQYHKVDYLAVAYADEGVELRKAGISLPIMVMNTEENGFPSLTNYDLQPVLYSFDLAHTFANYLHREGIRSFPVHIKFDTGMHRLGFEPDESAALATFLASSNLFHVLSAFSHLAAGEDPAEDEYTWKQAERFIQACDTMEGILQYDFLRHLSNTAAIFRHPGLSFDMVRLGIGLYGIDPSPGQNKLLREATTLRTTVAQVRRISAGETVGYNRRSTVSRDSVIATIRIGYADGFPRSLGNGAGNVWIRGDLAPVIGSVCMDMTMLDVTDIQGVQAGDEVVIFGQELSILQLSEWADTIPYAIMTGISQRVQRVYFEE